MGYLIPERLPFLENALQGLAFWMGHRTSYFRSYQLPEAALVTEACNLIQANLSDAQVLRPEVLYRRLVDITDSGLSELARADLVILARDTPNPYSEDVSQHVQFVMEVKRGSTSDELVNDDLRRLLAFKKACVTEARAFLIVASEAALPARFVEKKGTSRLHVDEIPNTGGFCKVRRTVKAASSFEKKETAHYVCIVEVFSERPKRKLPAF